MNRRVEALIIIVGGVITMQLEHAPNWAVGAAVYFFYLGWVLR